MTGKARFGATNVLILLLVVGFAGCMREDPVPAPCPTPSDFPGAEPNPRLAADAGPDQEAKVKQRVELDGTASVHAQGKNLTYHWDQLEGPCVTLANPDTATPSFVAPNVPREGALLRFRLVVESEGAYSNPDESEVIVTR